MDIRYLSGWVRSSRRILAFSRVLYLIVFSVVSRVTRYCKEEAKEFAAGYSEKCSCSRFLVVVFFIGTAIRRLLCLVIDIRLLNSDLSDTKKVVVTRCNGLQWTHTINIYGTKRGRQWYYLVVFFPDKSLGGLCCAVAIW